MNGSDLESEDGEATEDLCEMLAANISSQVNVLVETIGTKSWSKRLGIASDHTQRYKAEAGNLVLVDDSLGQLDCTSPDTLADFISWGAENYPANRYILIFWDHGAGPVYGFGYDEHQSEDSVLTIDEIQTAIRQSGIYFDIIGMDSCIMSSLELCCAMYNYCDYMILSEDFESGYGWSYTGWLNALSENTSISSEELGKIIVDEAADVISTHDRIQASVDRFFRRHEVQLVYEMNDARIRYKHNATGMLTAFFGTIVIICFMLLVFDHETSYQYSYNGRILGYVDDQEQVYNILNIAGEKLSKVNDAKIRFKVGQNITFKKVSSSKKDIDTADQALNKLTYMTEIDVVGYGIYEKDRLLAVVESKSVADKVLDDVVNYYRTPDKGMQLQKIGFKHHVEVKPVNVMLTSVMTRNEAEDILENGGKMSLQHIVMEDEDTAKLQEIYSADSQEIRVIGQSDSNREEEEADTTEKGDKNVSKGKKNRCGHRTVCRYGHYSNTGIGR